MSKTTKVIAVSLGALINIELAFADRCASKLDKAKDGWDELVTCIRQIETENEKLLGGVSIPSGAVLAFDLSDGCPEGWKAFDDASGRFILARGQGKNLTERLMREIGGTEQNQLTTKELPAHIHEFVGTTVSKGGNAGTGRVVAIGDSNSFGEFTPAGTIKSMGDGEAFSNMPPYIALYFCKKN